MPIRRRVLTFYHEDATKVKEPWFEVYCRKCGPINLVEDEEEAKWLDYKHQYHDKYGIYPLRRPT